MDQHSAHLIFFFKYRNIISALSKIIGTGQTRRTCSNHRHPVVRSPHFPFRILADRNVPLLLLQLLRCNKLLNLINGNRLIHGSTCAGILTTPVADGTADSREGIVLLDQLQRIQISSFSRQLHIALYRKMRGTGTLTGCSSRIITVDLRVLAVMNVPVVRRPLGCIRKERLRICDLRSVLSAQLLSKFRCSDRANLHALAAGNTFCPIHMRAIGRT